MVDWLKCWWFTSTDTVDLLGTGAQDVHLDFHTETELRSCVDVCLSLYNVSVSIRLPSVHLMSACRSFSVCIGCLYICLSLNAPHTLHFLFLSSLNSICVCVCVGGVCVCVCGGGGSSRGGEEGEEPIVDRKNGHASSRLPLAL